jgi:hypothetical protein
VEPAPEEPRDVSDASVFAPNDEHRHDDDNHDHHNNHDQEHHQHN